MKSIFFILTLIVATFNFHDCQAQADPEVESILNQKNFGFESRMSGWWTKDKQYWSITDEKSASGKVSCKFTCDAIPEQQNMKIESKNNHKVDDSFKINVEEGEYKIRLKVFLEEQHPKSLHLSFVEPNKAWLQSIIKFRKLETGKWIDVETKIKLTNIVNGKMVLMVPSNVTHGGEGTFYVDDIRLEKI
ncbi:hypothetical protein KMW28_23525 [Flammeovirga yaeyamensis]|uniref:Uncharacterized protein n=1 Tax=Flammeovirga yaeyamensis TaxID=367791 RepID=A0AAX1NG17_9BACT|nr:MULTISPECIES: hypothetical protein [Flammeovirga]ANQ51605.1 hypothetical protein MY04_4263 [Flammeovirga sp. MY04]MBB3696657.1 hypothetical protein [Flammeovirga yaeyamensis]NMF33330.1 hypothetical protein [Flammeovirga yaeyamensis]QWG05393.1 hypothetical protein KMW28_23525 [Flammeovirga yaeyamensis]